jgi:hypothetical protein
MGTNTLTGLIPDLYEAMDTVAREITGFIPSVTLNASAARAALNANIDSFVTPAAASENATAGQQPPDTGAQTIGANALKITKSKVVPFQWTGEEQLQVAPGHGHRAIQRDQIAQAIRTLVNEIEADCFTAALRASRAFGAAGTKAFNSGLGDAAGVRRILVDNGCPMGGGDVSLILGTYEGTTVRSQATVVNVADPSAMQLRDQGILMPLSGMVARESAAIRNPAVGSTTATVDATGYAVGSTTFTLTAAACALVVGDVITFAGDTNQYIVTGGTLANAGTLIIGSPGIKVAMSAAAKAITVVATANRNVALHRSAMQLALRTPAVPAEGDMAADRTVLTDPRTGISFEFAMYPQYRRVRYEVGAAWGAAVMKTDFIAHLIGLTG